MGEAVTTIEPGDEHWSTVLVGDDATPERIEALKEFETPIAFFDAHDNLANADWRKPLAGDDDKFLSTLQRFSAPEDMGNAFREAQQTIRSGQLQKPLADDASEEDVKAWRESNNIPLESAQYMENLPEGLVIGDDDKEIFGDFFEHLHAKNVKPEIAHDIISWYNGFAEKEQDAQADMDTEQAKTADDTLREDWASDYRANINLVNGMISSSFGKEAAEQLLNGRFPDGRAFMNDPAVVKGFAEIARQLNPIMELGGPHGEIQQTMNDEIATLEKYMAEERTKYNADTKAQERLRKLYQIRIDHAAKE